MPKTTTKELNYSLPKRVDRFPELKDFYDSFDKTTVLPSEKKKFDSLIKELIEEEIDPKLAANEAQLLLNPVAQRWRARHAGDFEDRIHRRQHGRNEAARRNLAIQHREGLQTALHEKGIKIHHLRPATGARRHRCGKQLLAPSTREKQLPTLQGRQRGKSDARDH